MKPRPVPCNAIRVSAFVCPTLFTEIDPNMSRPLVPSVVLAALAFAGHVRPRFTEDWPELAEARLIARAGEITAQTSGSCCDERECDCLV